MAYALPATRSSTTVKVATTAQLSSFALLAQMAPISRPRRIAAYSVPPIAIPVTLAFASLVTLGTFPMLVESASVSPHVLRLPMLILPAWIALSLLMRLPIPRP